MDDLDDIRAIAAEDEKSAALRRALRALDKAKVSRDELVAAVYQAAKDAAASVTIPPVPKRIAEPDKRIDPEAAVVLMADWQYGKTTPAPYDSDVARARIDRFTDKALRIIDYVRAHHPVPEVHCLYLGDLVEGELIFSGQAHRIDASLYRQVFEVGEIIANQVRRFQAHVDVVKVRGVIGNHGAIGGPFRREMHPETNADAMAINIARLHLPRVEFPEPMTKGEREWFAIHEVMGRKWFLAHGDQVKGASFGVPWYGFKKHIQGWYMTLGPFDYVATGHWHQTVREDINGIIHFGAGSTESANTYAQEWLAGGGQQGSQWLIFQNADGLTSEHPIRL